MLIVAVAEAEEHDIAFVVDKFVAAVPRNVERARMDVKRAPSVAGRRALPLDKLVQQERYLATLQR